MHILVDTALNNGLAEYSNLGDVAMLQVAYQRLRELWPSASIEVLTESSTNLALFCPEAKPLPRSGRDLWVGENAILGGFERLLPPGASLASAGFSRSFRLRYPAAFRLLTHLRLAIRDRRNVRPSVNSFLVSLKHADLFVVCGAGGFTDSTREWNISTLNTVEEAIQRNVPVVMFGQGMGPLNDLRVQCRARKVLPKVRLLSLRGARGGQAVAERLGVNPSQLVTTGDEAVELAYNARARESGHAVGINLRVASYSNVHQRVIERLRPNLHNFARAHKVPMLPIPIAFHAWANDHLTIQQLLKGFDDHSDGGINLDTPLKVIEQAGRCRFVVTGAYHAAVFALSQGIPIVGLSASEDYTAKFGGLQDQFGLGCEIVQLDKPDVCEQLASAMERTWKSADQVRLPLQESARRQIELSRGVHERVKKNLSFRRNGASAAVVR